VKCIIRAARYAHRWSKLTRMEPLMLMAISGVRERRRRCFSPEQLQFHHWVTPS